MKYTKLVIAIVAAMMAAMLIAAMPAGEAEAATLKAGTVTATKTVKAKRPNAKRVVRGKDGNLYALYETDWGRAAAFTGIKKHTKSVTIPRYVKFKGKRYEVTAIHEFGLFERTDVKYVRILAKNIETIEEPALFRDWRVCHHKKVKVSVKYKVIRDWLNARW